MPKNSRYYYKRYLEEGLEHLYIAHQRLLSAYALTGESGYIEHKLFIAEFDKQLFAMAENLKQYEATI